MSPEKCLEKCDIVKLTALQYHILSHFNCADGEKTQYFKT